MSVNYEALMSTVQRVAKSVTKNFPSYVTTDDTEGALYLWIADKKLWIESLEGNDRDISNKITPILRKVAYTHCEKEKAAAEGYEPGDVYNYTVGKVRSILPDALSYLDWQSFGTFSDGQPKAKKQANETGDKLAEIIDVCSALERINDDAFDLLMLKYKYNRSSEEIGAMFAIQPEAAKKRAQRAEGALMRELGRRPYDVGARRSERRAVHSNAAARARLSHQYEGQ